MINYTQRVGKVNFFDRRCAKAHGRRRQGGQFDSRKDVGLIRYIGAVSSAVWIFELESVMLQSQPSIFNEI